MDEYDQVIQALPSWLARPLLELPSTLAPQVQEVRLRVGCTPMLTVRGAVYAPQKLGREGKALQTLRLTPPQMEEILFTLCGGSVHTHQTEIAQGYVTLASGCRAGLGGQFLQTAEQGIVLQELTSVNLRIARKKTIDLPEELRAALQEHFIGMLLVGEPGSGKTTVLKNILENMEGIKTGVIQNEFGKVGIDMIAGPSEILVLADGGCNPAWVAADLLSQAEHDKLASPVLVTDSPELAQAVQAELEVQIPQLPRAAIARASVDDNGKIIVCTDLHKAIEACNIIAPEHLEVCVEDPFGVLNEIKNAGSIFLGRNVPEALGDYFAGPNHTLPTSGTARFSSPLGVDDFVKKSSFLYYTREALGEVAPRIADFAEREGLHAHAKSVTIRYEK